MRQHYWTLSLCFLSSIVLGAVVPSPHDLDQLLLDGEAALEPRYHSTIKARDISNPQRGEWYRIKPQERLPPTYGAMILECTYSDKDHPKMYNVAMLVQAGQPGYSHVAPLINYVDYPSKLGNLELVIECVWQDELEALVSLPFTEVMIKKLECELDLPPLFPAEARPKLFFTRGRPRESYVIIESRKDDYPKIRDLVMFIMSMSGDVPTFAALGPPKGGPYSTLAEPYLPRSQYLTPLTALLLEEYKKAQYVFFVVQGVPPHHVERTETGSPQDFSLGIPLGNRLEQELHSLLNKPLQA